jgi:hypothetical protein
MTYQPIKIEQRDPKALRMHKLRKHFPAIDKNSPEWKAFTDSLHASGFTQNLVITAEGFVVTNYSAWALESAKDWQMTAVPCAVIHDDLAGIVLAESAVCQTEHMTRGAAVFLMIPILKDVVQSAEMRRLANIRQGVKTDEIELKPQCFSMGSNFTSGNELSIRGLCARWGLGYKTFYKAKEVYALLYNVDCTELKEIYREARKAVPAIEDLRQVQRDFRDELVPKLTNGEKNLWNVESGIKGAITGGAGEPRQKYLNLFGEALESLAVRAARFESPNKAAAEIRQWLNDVESKADAAGEDFEAKLTSMASATKIASDTMQARLKELAKQAA